MQSIYAKVSADNGRYLDTLTAAVTAETDTPVSKGQIINMIITEARTRGWSVAIDSVRITSPATQETGQ